MAKLPLKTAEHQIIDLQNRLQEAEDTLEAIRIGAVDALVVKGGDSQEIFTLKSADYMYRMLIESMNQGALTLNFDGTVLYSNKQFSSMLGLPLEKIIGESFFSFVAPEDCRGFENLIKKAKKTDCKIEINLQAARMKKLTVIVSVNTVFQEGELSYLCVVVTDMTERKRAEDAKDEFISVASHQLRTPATSVKQYVNMVLDGMFGDLNNAQKEALHKANTSNERELKIVDDLLKVAQIDAGKIVATKHQVNLDSLLEGVISDMHQQIRRRNQNIKYKAAPEPVLVNVDESLTRMVAENLIDNASKYMPESGTITISTETKNNQAIFKVADQGVGMSIKGSDRQKLFQKFSRQHNSLSVKVGGNGLGLYWVKKVIDLHGGKIAVSSVIGKGTVFTVMLPKNR